MDLRELESKASEIAGALSSDGFLHLPSLLVGEPAFERYVADLGVLVHQLCERVGIEPRPEAGLDLMVPELFARDEKLPYYLSNLTSHPNKLLSGQSLKLEPGVLALCRAHFGEQAVLASPALSDQVTFFLPNEPYPKVVFPVHQDYPYQLQSPRMLTFWIPLSENTGDCGGVLVWRSSHRAGIRGIDTAEGHLTAAIDEESLKEFERVDVPWSRGDLLVFDGLLLHASRPNRSSTRARILHTFRLTDINCEEAASQFWRSREHPNLASPDRSVTFEQLHPELVTEAGG